MLSRQQSSAAPAGRAVEALDDVYTLTPLQQGMLFHVLSAPQDHLYFDQTLCTVRGALDEAAFRRAWQLVIERHPALRTGFLWEGLRQPVQVVYREAPLVFVAEDWRGQTEGTRSARLQAVIEEDRGLGVDLTRPPLMRLRWIRTGERSGWLLWSVSHLVMDAWSSSLVLEEVAQLYGALRRGSRAELPPARPYREYVRWIKERDCFETEEFWRGSLAGFREPTLVAPVAPCATDKEATGRAIEEVRLSQALSESLRTMARSHGLTLNTVVQGAWALLLAQRSQRRDVVYGLAVAGRSAPVVGLDSMVGPCVNTLPQRVRLAANQGLVPWLRQLQSDQVQLREREHTPLSKVLAWSELGSGEALFDSLFVFLNVADLSRQPESELRIEELRYFGRPHYALTLHVVPAERLRLEVAFDARRIGPAAVRSWLESFEHLLAALPERAPATLDELLAEGRSFEQQRSEERRRRRRDANSDRLRDTRPIAIQLWKPE